MAPAESPLPQPILLTPLVIALGIIAVVGLTLVALHYLLKKLRFRNPLTASQTIKASHGVDKKVLDSIPIRPYAMDHKFICSDQHECSVCLSTLEGGEMVRVLPNCHHVFHFQCIDAWLASHSNCPFCRSEITAPESFVVTVDVIEGSTEALPRDGELRRSNTLVWPCEPGLLSFREKLKLKRCLSLDFCNVAP